MPIRQEAKGEYGSIGGRVERDPAGAFDALVGVAVEKALGPLLEALQVDEPVGRVSWPEGLMTAEEAAAYLRTDKQTLYRLAKAGVIPGRAPDEHWRAWRFSAIALEAWAAGRDVADTFASLRRAA